MNDKLNLFHEYRTVFKDIGLRPDGFSLPRQHALNTMFIHQAVWLTEWAVLVNHGVQAHPCSEATLATIEARKARLHRFFGPTND